MNQRTHLKGARIVLVVSALLLSALQLASSNQEAFRVEAPGVSPFTVSLGSALPAVSAWGLAGLAAGVVAALLAGRAALVAAVMGMVAGVGAAVALLDGAANPSPAVAGAAQIHLGVSGPALFDAMGQLTAGPWLFVSLGTAIGQVLAWGAVGVLSFRLPNRAREFNRYVRPVSARDVRRTKAVGPGPRVPGGTDLDFRAHDWDSLDRGEDPTSPTARAPRDGT